MGLEVGDRPVTELGYLVGLIDLIEGSISNSSQFFIAGSRYHRTGDVPTLSRILYKRSMRIPFTFGQMFTIAL